MLKKFQNRNEMNDSALRDIIPSNEEIATTKKPPEKRFSKICKYLLVILILGLLAIGIVVLGLTLTFSGRSFMKYITHFSEENLFNKTLGPPNLTSTLDEQNWKKITLDIHRPSSTIETPTTQSNQKTQKIPLTTLRLLQSSKKKILDEDHLIDDLFDA